MSIRDALKLDHFYISVCDEDFESLISLTKVLKSCVHKKVISDSDSWEGIYLLSQTGVYLEIVRERRSGGLGVACSVPVGTGVDARKIVDEMGGLEWQTGKRVRADGSPWFDWLSLGEYENVSGSIFNAWIMQYAKGVTRWAALKDEARSVERFLKIELELGKSHASEVNRLSEWMPGRKTFSENSVVFKIPDSGGSMFEVLIGLTDTDQPFQFKRLLMSRAEELSISAQEIGRFNLKTNGSEVILSG